MLPLILLTAVSGFSLCQAGESEKKISPIEKLERIEENFDGGSISFFFGTRADGLRLVLMDQSFLKEHGMENPELQRIFLVEAGKSVPVAPGSAAEECLVQTLTAYAETLEADDTMRSKVNQLLLILKNRSTAAVSRSFWYR
jgi:hypothetical protein